MGIAGRPSGRGRVPRFGRIGLHARLHHRRGRRLAGAVMVGSAPPSLVTGPLSEDPSHESTTRSFPRELGATRSFTPSLNSARRDKLETLKSLEPGLGTPWLLSQGARSIACSLARLAVLGKGIILNGGASADGLSGGGGGDGAPGSLPEVPADSPGFPRFPFAPNLPESLICGPLNKAPFSIGALWPLS